MTAYLLDANVLIALTVAEHEHHDAAVGWFSGSGQCAVCPVVEGALLRFLLRMGESGATAAALLDGVRSHPRVSFWPDDVSYRNVPLTDLHGHAQVTDAYLAELASTHGGRLATFDARLSALRPDQVLLVDR